MTLCVPFLAYDRAQLNSRWAGPAYGIEAAVFDRDDIMDSSRWSAVVANLSWVRQSFAPKAFIFHFPVNNSNYLVDKTVERRLFESFDLAAKHRLDGIVLHSNQIYPKTAWRHMNVTDSRKRYLDYLEGLRRRLHGAPFWLGIENMPIMGNRCDELDPLFIYPDDMRGVAGGAVGVTWDVCHYSYTVAVSHILLNARGLNRADYPVVRECGYTSFRKIAPDVVHWHFSGFKGIADEHGAVCEEGQPPWESLPPQSVYADAYDFICRHRAQTVTLEIAEEDYARRKNILDVIAWCEARQPKQRQ